MFYERSAGDGDKMHLRLQTWGAALSFQTTEACCARFTRLSGCRPVLVVHPWLSFNPLGASHPYWARLTIGT